MPKIVDISCSAHWKKLEESLTGKLSPEEIDNYHLMFMIGVEYQQRMIDFLMDTCGEEAGRHFYNTLVKEVRIFFAERDAALLDSVLDPSTSAYKH